MFNKENNVWEEATFKIIKSARNLPIIELNNYYLLNDCELDVKEEEIILLEVQHA